MTLVMMSLPLEHVFQCLLTYFTLVSTFVLISRDLTAQSMGSHRGIGAGNQIPEMLLQALLPFPALPPKCPGELAYRLPSSLSLPSLT